MFQCILVIVLSALLDVWAYVGHVALVPLSSNPRHGGGDGPKGNWIYTYPPPCAARNGVLEHYMGD